MPTLTNVGSFQLPFGVYILIAFNNQGVVVEQFSDNKLAKYNLSLRSDERTGASSSCTEEPSTYTLAWEKPRPAEMRAGSEKVLLSSGQLVTRHCDVNTTFVFSADLELQQSVTGMKASDYLVAEIPPDRLMYINKYNYQLALYQGSDHQFVLSLSPNVHSIRISASRHSTAKWFVVVEYRSNSSGDMLIYNDNCQLHKRIDLPFAPRGINAVTCVNDFIIVASLDNLHVYNWEGERVGEVDARSLEREKEREREN